MKKYFIYELKKNSYVIGVFSLILVVLHIAPILITDSKMLEHNYGFTLLSVYIGVLAAIVPMWLTRYKMKKRSVDLYYALPLSHTKILAVKFLFGLIAIFVPYTVVFWFGALCLIAKIGYAINAVWFVSLFFASLIPIYIIYSVSAFVFTRANRGVDGFVFLIFWCFALSLLVFFLQTLVDADDFYPAYFLPFEPLYVVTSYFQDRIYFDSLTGGMLNERKICMSVGFVVTALMSAGATVGLLLTERKAKAENVGQISDSWFGYKIMIPFYTVCLTGLCILDSYLSALIIILIATTMFFTSVLYRRSIKIGKNQAITLSVSLLAGVILAIVNTYRG